jgi:hypothetical protein
MHERFGRGNIIERFFGYMKKKVEGFYSNTNSYKIQPLEDCASTIAIIRNILITIKTQEGVLPGRQDPEFPLTMIIGIVL